MRLLLSLCVMQMVLWSAVQGNGENGGQPHPCPPVHDTDRFNGSLRIYHQNADFAFRLYKHISALPDSQSKNVFFSPLSVSVSLAALSVGARGETHQQLFEGLGFNGTDVTAEEVNEAFQHIFQDLNKKTDVELSLGSAVFINDKFKPHAEFLESIKRYYQADGFSTDFQKASEAKDQINKYVNEKTKGKIAQLVDNLGLDVVMYLVSYIHFKGKWEIPFSPTLTKEDTFHLDDKTTVPVQMMTMEDLMSAHHDEETSTHVLRLDYNESVSMLLVLPEKGMKELDKVICRAYLRKWMRSRMTRRYKVFVPKLSLKTSYKLKEVLKEMGITDIFQDTANLAGISDEPLFVSKVVHKATLDVDEAGSEAAAATGVEISRRTFPVSYSTLTFNRPFMVFMLNRDTRSILFMGKVVNPAET
ncbi:serine protease inhibitor 2.1-like [Megalops cyprinoides]|uniref:serine protease inhibitor 2.1-like n=1 Tax=Megalops cyprinoides TaxID=118141 RepID=UPI0018646C8F|nr:serine protease inhibitor 2.1-like [Megalops cyprinoides]